MSKFVKNVTDMPSRIFFEFKMKEEINKASTMSDQLFARLLRVSHNTSYIQKLQLFPQEIFVEPNSINLSGS